MYSEIVSQVNNFKKNGKTIGLVHGVFDVIHVGHIKYFEEAKKKVDILIASVTEDKFANKAPGKPIFTTEQRIEVLKNIKSIDRVIKSSKSSSVEIINLIKPDIYFKGKDYKEKIDVTKNILKEKKAVKKNGGRIIFTESEIFSSSKIINESFKYLNPEFQNFVKKNKIKGLKDKFYNAFKNKINKKILLIGDPIIDIYKYVKPTGKSNKATIISTMYQNKKIYGGGTFLTSNALYNFFKEVNILKFSNKKNNNFYKSFLEKDVKKIQIKTEINLVKKIRYIDNYSNIKLFQVTENENLVLDEKTNDKVIKIIKKLIKKCDYIFIFDYGYFSLNTQIIELINKAGNEKKIINCQTNSYNYGFNNFTKYKNCKIMCIDELEFRLATNDKTTDILDLFKKNYALLKKYKNFIVTLGKKGCIIKSGKKINYVPTLFNIGKDTIGCGDIFMSVLGILKISNKFSPIECCIISHLAAGLHADSYGNENVINFQRMFKAIDNLIK
jgi:rfaE bifunctional protein nucleotidyltransferase chain/domain